MDDWKGITILKEDGKEIFATKDEIAEYFEPMFEEVLDSLEYELENARPDAEIAFIFALGLLTFKLIPNDIKENILNSF